MEGGGKQSNVLRVQRVSEGEIERKLTKAVKAAGGLAVKFYCPTFTGLPDRIVLLPGARIGFIELKRPGEKPTKRQEYVHGILRRLGFQISTVDHPDQIPEALNLILK